MAESLKAKGSFESTTFHNNVFGVVFEKSSSPFTDRMEGAAKDNIFNLLRDDGNMTSLKASEITLAKFGSKWMKRFRNREPVVNPSELRNVPKTSGSQLNLDKNRFDEISVAVYETLHGKKKLNIDLKPHEMVHFVGSIFYYAFLRGHGATGKVESWMESQTAVMPETKSISYRMLVQLLNNSSGDSQFQLKLKAKGKQPTGKSKRDRLVYVQRLRYVFCLVLECFV